MSRPDGLPRLVEVAIDTEFHSGAQPEDDVQRVTWEVLDTAWNLLREGAVRVTLAEVRAQFREKGIGELPSDEELFREARESGDPDAPRSYLDLALNRGDGALVELAGLNLQAAFQALADQTFTGAAEAMGFAVEG